MSKLDTIQKLMNTAERIGSRFTFFPTADARLLVDIADAACEWRHVVAACQEDKMAELRSLMALRDSVAAFEGDC